MPDADTRRLLDTLFRSEGPRLRRYFHRRLRAGEDARDFVQEAFTRMATATAGVLPAQPAAYLQRIATNMLIDRSRRPAILQCPDHADVAVRAEQEDALIAEDLMDVYRATLDELPDRTRTVFLLHRIDGLKYREIGDRLGISIPAVQKHMAKALERIALALQGEQ